MLHKNIDKDLLIDCYLNKRLSIQEIANYFNVSKQTINSRLKLYNIALRGHKGKIVSEQTKQILSQKAKLRKSPMLGKKHSNEAKLKMSQAGRGINKRKHNPNWDGSRTPIHNKFMNSAAWIEKRNYVFQRDNYICQITNIRGNDLECHHIIPKHLLPQSLWLDDRNLITLSKDAHKKINGKELQFTDNFFRLLVDKKIIKNTDDFRKLVTS